MIFYIKCPGCSRILSYNLDKYFDELDNIRNDPKKSKAEKDVLFSELLIKYNYIVLCCRIRIMGMIPAHKIIVT